MRRQEKNKALRSRIRALAFIIYLLFCVMAGKAVYYQVIIRNWLADKALGQYERQEIITGKRGDIFDACHRKLAVSLDVTSVAVHPLQVVDARKTATALSDTLGVNRQEVIAKLLSKKPFVWIKRQISPKESSTLEAMKLPGVMFVPDHSRFYPNRSLAGQVIGFCGIDGNGIEGLEYYYNSELQGRRDRVKVLRDALGRRLDPDKNSDSDYNGHNLVLTIDGAIQYTAEKALEDAVVEYAAKSGIAIVMDPRTGGVLALAQYPRFNPNRYQDYSRYDIRNRAFTDPYEPGSTMKIFSACAAIQSKLCTPTTTFYCENGAYRLGPNVIHDTHSYGTLTLQEIIKYSSNIGATKVSQLIGAETIYNNLRNFGFGEKTGVEASGESPGLLSSYTHWRKIDEGTIAFGQGISVTAIQLITATCAVANGGTLMQPHLVQAITDSNGKIIRKIEPHPVRRVVSEKTARTVTQMLETVVAPGGTGVNAAIDGYDVCGKTGTAQKIEHGVYAKGKYEGSFIGFFPADHPEAVILVVVDEPQKKYYGGTVAAPAFRRIALETAGYLNIPPGNIPDRFAVSTDREVKG